MVTAATRAPPTWRYVHGPRKRPESWMEPPWPLVRIHHTLCAFADATAWSENATRSHLSRSEARPLRTKGEMSAPTVSPAAAAPATTRAGLGARIWRARNRGPGTHAWGLVTT